MAHFQDSDAYDALPQVLRIAIQQSVGGADARVVLARFSKYGSEKTLRWLRSQDTEIMRSNRFFIGGVANLVLSTYEACKVKPLRVAA